MTDLLPGELEVIKYYIKDKDGDIIFDIGGFQGEWTQEVLRLKPKCCVHIFEPSINSFTKMSENLSKFITKRKVIPSRCCISNDSGSSCFWEYDSTPVLSTLYKRNENEMKRHGVLNPRRSVVIKITLDEYCKSNDIKYIDFLKIDTEGSEFDVLKGADNLLTKKRIRIIQFEYGKCFLDSESTLEEIFLFLRKRGYLIGKITAEGIDFIHCFLPEMEDYDYCNYLGIYQDKNMFKIQFDTTE